MAKKWKQPRCPSVGKWVNKNWAHPFNEMGLALERSELIKPWIDPGGILLLSGSQPEKAVYNTIPKQNYRGSKKIRGFHSWA